MSTTYLATLNGYPVTARKVAGRWMVGGDYDLSGDIQVILPVKGRPAWHTLHGAVLKFSDFVTADELAAFHTDEHSMTRHQF